MALYFYLNWGTLICIYSGTLRPAQAHLDLPKLTQTYLNNGTASVE